MSRIEQLIAELCPDGVEFKELGEIGEFIRGNGLQKKDFTESGLGCIHYGQIFTYYGRTAVKTKSFVAPSFAKKLRKAQKGNLVIATTSENVEDVCKAVVWLGEEEIAISGDAYIYKHNQSPKYIAYFYQTQMFFNKKLKYATGTKVIRVSGDNMAKIKIPIPPLPIQQEIVRILDTFTDLDAELQAELEARKKQYEHYRNQLLNFEGKEVEWKMLGDLTDFMNGKGHEKEIVENGKYIVVNSKFISTDGTIKKYSNNQLSPIYIDDILIVMSDLPNGKALAKCFYVEKDNVYTLNQRIGRLSVNYKYEVTPKYIFFILNRNKQLLKYDNGSDQTNLRKNQILEIKIPIPPLAEQERIVSILDKFEALVNDELPAEIAARRKQYEHYREKLLTFEPLVS